MNDRSLLRGVPRVYYGAFGGITPFPICLKAVSDYLGDPVDYQNVMVASGAAFRFAWDTTGWNGGNVDIALTYDDCERPYRNGVTALGRSFKMLWRKDNAWGHPGSATREEYRDFITAEIDAGRPLISLGPVGPSEAGILTGYADGGETLCGWSCFQYGMPTEPEEGCYLSNNWWDCEFPGVMSLGPVTGPRMTETEILCNAIEALEGRQEGVYAKGVAAYDAWKRAVLEADETDFAQTIGGDHLVMMCHSDATDCLVDGRTNAASWFSTLAEAHPEQPLYGRIAAQFSRIGREIREQVYSLLGGYERGSAQIAALEDPAIRKQLGACIDRMRTADETALALMKELAASILAL